MRGYADTQALATIARPTTQNTSHSQRAFWRLDEPVLREGMVKKGGLFEHQRDWWELPNFIRALVGGYGSGKTNALAKRMIALAMINAPVPVITVSPTFSVARETIIATIRELLDGKQTLVGKALRYRYNKSLHTFHIRYRGRSARIISYSGEHPDSLRGPNIAAAGIDEPFIQDRAVFNQVLARIRHPEAKVKEVNLTGTPEQLNWGFELCEGDEKENHDVGLVHASTRENLAIASDYADRLEKAYSDREVDAYVGGKFVSLSIGQVYYAFDRHQNVVPDCPAKFRRERKAKLVVDGDMLHIPHGATFGVGMDFNVDPMAAVVFWRLGEHMHYFDEIELPNADTEYMCSVLRDKPYGELLKVVYPDSTGGSRNTRAPRGKTDFHYIKEAGFEIDAPTRNPLRKDRYNSANGRLKSKKGDRNITVAARCKKLILYLTTHTHELMKKQEHMTHLLDAFSYPVYRLFPVSYATMNVRKLTGT